jgi:hypothetical protein
VNDWLEPGVHLHLDQLGQQPRELDAGEELHAWTAPRTWVAGEVVTATIMNQHIRDNLNFLNEPPACLVYNTGSQSIANNTPTNLTFNSELYDTDSFITTPASSFSVGSIPGRYALWCSVSWAGVAGGVREIYIVAAGAIIARKTVGSLGAGVTHYQTASAVYQFASTQTVQFGVNQNSGGSVSINNSGAGGTADCIAGIKKL